MNSIHQIVRDAEQNYTEGSTQISEYVEFDMHDTIEKIDAYLNSKHTSGDTDSLGREKPFFNIVTAATNIWYRATDLDRKNIKILSNNSGTVVSAFIASIILQNWMDKSRFGAFLNNWGRTLAKYGSAVLKFVEKGGELHPRVVPWSKFIPDPIDFDSIPRIERFYKTPSQLRAMATKGHPDYAGYYMEAVEKLIESQTTRKTVDGFQQDNQSKFIELFEVHGELPSHLLSGTKPEDESETEYIQQMHVVSYIATGTDSNGSKEFEDFTLYKGREKQDPYMITHLIQEDNRTLGIGAVEYLFDAQWMQNHSMKQWKDQLDLASKLIFQTADSNYVGRNVLTAIETGDIMVHEVNKPLTLINNQGHDISSVQSFMSQWKVIGNEMVGVSEAMLGGTPKAGTPWRQTEALLQESYSLFEVMTQSKQFAIEDMMTRFIIPHIKKKMDTKDEIVAILDQAGISQIDSMYIPKEAIKRFNRKTIKQVLEMTPEQMMRGEIPQPYDPATGEAEVQKELATMGNQRFIKPSEMDDKTWKEVVKDLEWEVRVDVGNENRDKQTILTTLTTIFRTLAQTNPQQANLVLNKIMTETGTVSPLELSTVQNNQPSASPPVGGAQEAELSALAKQ